ncbi:hypothetical protein MRI28_25610 [Nocardiopsis dassonvillei]|uniref:hypothetical protein n=1 Tax=Nocardiopsis dassonvillei TaxID=2014 RepID=UPI0020101B17|nr:hypothetical protein [Nocardiopsis dassonvillei]MCK9872966.1 hypothetical protein [Nocardiopsis dassonvillei]
MTLPSRSAVPVYTHLAGTPAVPLRPGRTPAPGQIPDRFYRAVMGRAARTLGIGRLVYAHTSRPPRCFDPHVGAWCEAATTVGVRRIVHLHPPGQDPPHPGAPQWQERSASADLADPDQVRAALTTAGVLPGPPVLALTGTAPVYYGNASLVHLVSTLAEVLPAGSRIGLLQPCGATTRADFARHTQASGHGHHARTGHELHELLTRAGFDDLVGPHPAATWPLPTVPSSGTDTLFALLTAPGTPPPAGSARFLGST